MSGEKITQRRAFPVWAKALLAVSLALNLMVAGVVVGSRFDGDHGKGPSSRTPREGRAAFDPALGPFSRALPDPYRQQAVDALRERAGDFRDNRADLAGQVTSMLDILKTEPFDEEGLRALMAAQTEVFERRGEIGRDVVIEQIGSMTPEERAALAERMEEGFRRALDRARPPRPE
ncbi:MAG: periplasmic heavy metal sensor [Pseudomonadota bacterium]|nr:periplasmic heavy metal sensor [Pseudomonadota bacterium]